MKARIINNNLICQIAAIFGVLVILGSCSAKTDSQNERTKRQDTIKEFADKVNENPVLLTKSTADTLLIMYGDYIADFPDDTMSEYYLFQMSNIYQALNQCDSALYCLDKIIKDYPNGQKVGAAYFFRGVVLNDVCLNKEESIKAFETYIEKFPQSKHVETAKKMIMMDTMKNPVDLLKQ